MTQIRVEPSMSDILTEFKKIQTQVNKLCSHQYEQPGGGQFPSNSWQPTIEPQQMFTSTVTTTFRSGKHINA